MKRIFGNWKMAQSLDALERFFASWDLKENSKVETAVFPSFCHLLAAQAAVSRAKLPIEIGAQDCSTEEAGAFTGEVSAAMIKELGMKYILIGHSERRQRAPESVGSLNRKLLHSFQAGLIPVFCIGENLEQRKAGQVLEILDQQVQLINAVAEKHDYIIAYEPVWAIGTGITPSLHEIEEAHRFVQEKSPRALAVLYGGSVKPENAGETLKLASVGGLLVGGASLKATDFKKIVESALKG